MSTLGTSVMPVVPISSPEPPSRPALVRARSLTKNYGSLAAVDNIDFDIPRGSIFGLIGPNGAGKSTTFAMVASLLIPTSGTVTIADFNPMTDRMQVRRRVGYMPDNIGVYGDLTAVDYLRFFAASYRIKPKAWDPLVDGLLELVDLADKRDAQVDSLSRGMKQRLSLARALVHDPELLILDEPASGLDPRARVELRELLLQLARMGKTILISSHILAELEAVCSDIAIMEGGRIHAIGAPADIRAATNTGSRVAVAFTDGSTEEYPVSDALTQAALLRRLVIEDPRDVLSFAPVDADLEGLYMQITDTVRAGEVETAAVASVDPLLDPMAGT